jgi:hypothetical protein
MKTLVNSTDIPAVDGVLWTVWPGNGQVYAAPVVGMRGRQFLDGPEQAAPP